MQNLKVLFIFLKWNWFLQWRIVLFYDDKQILFLLGLWNNSPGVTDLIYFHLGTSINDVPRFLAIFDLPTLAYSITSHLAFGGYLGPYLP